MTMDQQQFNATVAAVASMFFGPLHLKPVHADMGGESYVMDSQTAQISTVTNDDFANAAVNAINALAWLATQPRPAEAPAQPQPADDDGWQWAIVEIMGHRKHVGRVREEEMVGVKRLRVDEPMFIGRQEGDRWPRKIVDLRLDRWETHYYGGAAIFCLTPTDEKTALEIRKREATIAPPASFQLTDERRDEIVEHEEGDDSAHDDDDEFAETE